MAEPIQMIKKNKLTSEEKISETLKELTNELTDHEATVKKLLAVFSELNDSGVLESVESFLKAKSKITEIALGQATRPEATNLLNNLLGLAGALTDVDPEQTQTLISSVSNGLKNAEEHQKVSILSLMSALKDPDINRAIGFGLSFLKGFGEGLK